MLKGRIIGILIIVMASVFCISCGTGGGGGGGTAPSRVTSPAYEDPSQNLYSFLTADSANITENPSTYKGTAVLYKIYTNLSTLYSEVDAINAANTGSPESGYSKLQSYNFQFMCGGIIFSPAASDRSISIRLFNETAYTAGITINGGGAGFPTRSGSLTGSSFTFTSSYYPNLGGATDNDFTGVATADGPWYVAAYAAAAVQQPVGLNYSYSLRYLGVLRIKKS